MIYKFQNQKLFAHSKIFVLSFWIGAEPNFIILLQEEVVLAIKKTQPTTAKFKNSPTAVGG